MQHWKTITTIFLLFTTIPVLAQSDDLPPITTENAQQLALIKTIPFPAPVYDSLESRYFAAAFSPDGSQIALVQNGKFTLINIDDGSTAAEIQEGVAVRPLGVYLSADGTQLAAVDHDRFCIWHISDNVITFCTSLSINLPEEISGGMNYARIAAVTFSVDMTRLYVAATYSSLQGIVVHIYDLKQLREVDRLQIKDCWVGSSNLIAFQHTTAHLVCTNSYATQTGQTYLFMYEPNTGELLSSWNIGDDIPEEIVRNQYGTLANSQSQEVMFIPPVAYPYDRYQKLFSPVMTIIAVIPSIGDGVELYGVSDCTATAERDLNLRVEANTDATTGATFIAGSRLALIAKTSSEGFAWWQTGDGLWVREDVADIDCPHLE